MKNAFHLQGGARKCWPFKAFSVTVSGTKSLHGMTLNSLHTGGVTGSIPVAPTMKSMAYGICLSAVALHCKAAGAVP